MYCTWNWPHVTNTSFYNTYIHTYVDWGFMMQHRRGKVWYGIKTKSDSDIIWADAYHIRTDLNDKGPKEGRRQSLSITYFELTHPLTVLGNPWTAPHYDITYTINPHQLLHSNWIHLMQHRLDDFELDCFHPKQQWLGRVQCWLHTAWLEYVCQGVVWWTFGYDCTHCYNSSKSSECGDN